MYLLDTHVLIWWLTQATELPIEIRRLIEDENKIFFVSIASAWEMAIKRNLGKLETPDDLEEALRQNQFQALPINFMHIEKLAVLPNHHRDPFDRMLIAQAISENLTIITHDSQFQPYGCSLILF
ncbi:MAG: type II toxin-antitoxin system VapC family toxin [Myxococcaceae bacterium]